ncbi:MAG: Stp1/IreP family PP2C-type Ser/Thr phosphatase [Clostridia bacterium]|nr:Stp1/IreP family PP2C-type Ser/Thr phosphatase [Clostridia bacterium]
MDFGYKTDVGSMRSLNEDNFLLNNTNEKYTVMAVADGMGGHNAGEVASADAIAYLKGYDESTGFSTSIKNRLLSCFEAINTFIYKQSVKTSRFAGMGTTLTVAVIARGRLYAANVGDSRCYVINKYEIKQITNDHSFVEELVRLGKLTKEEAKNHPEKNKLMQAIGTEPTVNTDLFTEDLKKGDIVLLCTDGLSNMVAEEEIKNILLTSENVQTAIDTLIAEANRNGGIDNITAVAVKID